MHSSQSIFLVAIAAVLHLCLASAHINELHPYHAPSKSDSRSPCPGLNALANHGLLPRNGRNIDLSTLVQGAYLGYSLAEGATLLVGAVGLRASKTGNNATFDLADLNQHDPQVIEHDGSMTRQDAYWGDSLTFSHSAYARTLAGWGDNGIISFEVAAAERAARFAYGEATNPEFNATFAATGSLLEYALALSVFGDVTDGNANRTLLKYWFENERLPTELGWQRPSDNITVTSVTTMSGKIAAAAAAAL